LTIPSFQQDTDNFAYEIVLMRILICGDLAPAVFRKMIYGMIDQIESTSTSDSVSTALAIARSCLTLNQPFRALDRLDRLLDQMDAF
jgi:hypothetical protein